MKNSIIKIWMLASAVLIIVAVACETNAETYSEFTEDGEVLYVGRPDTVIVAPAGINKSRFSIKLNADPKIQKGTLKTVNGTVVHEFAVDRGSLVDNVLEFELDVEEGDYTYSITMEDDAGNTSVSREFQFRVYGDKYRATLIPRSISNLQAFPDRAILQWADVQPGALSTMLTYEDSAGEMQTLEVSNADDETILDDYALNGEIEVASNFKPTTNSLAEYASFPVELSFPDQFLLDKSLISVASLAGDTGADGCFGFPLDRLFDGTATMWHSCGPDTPSAFPYIHSFDLGITAKLSEFRLDARTDCCQGRSPAAYQIWGTNDVSGTETIDIKTVDLADWEADATSKGWVKLLDVAGNADTSFNVDIPEAAEGYRYFRFVALEAIDGGDWANYAEFTLWASEAE